MKERPYPHETIEQLAAKQDIETLIPANIDAVDFIELNVLQIKEMLDEAFTAGRLYQKKVSRAAAKSVVNPYGIGR